MGDPAGLEDVPPELQPSNFLGIHLRVTSKLEDGEYFWRASKTTGGGGWGNPLERDPERVKNDVRDEYVTIEGALRDYGVVITGDPINDPEGLKVDAKATAARRKEMARQSA